MLQIGIIAKVPPNNEHYYLLVRLEKKRSSYYYTNARKLSSVIKEKNSKKKLKCSKRTKASLERKNFKKNKSEDCGIRTLLTSLVSSLSMDTTYGLRFTCIT